MELRRILCPTDFSEPAHEAWRPAIDPARGFRAERFLLHVIKPALPPAEAMLSPDQDQLRWRQAVRDAERELGRLIDEGRSRVRITRLREAA